MTTTRTSPTPAALVSTGARLAAAIAVTAILSAAWLVAGDESRAAVRASAAAMGPKTLYVTLPPVEIIGKREPVARTDVAGTPASPRNAL